MFDSERVALVHDYLLVLRGAERTFAVMADTWSQAPLFTLLYDEHGTQGRFAGRDVRTSPLQRLRLSQRSFRRLLPLLPAAAGRLDARAYDVVISSSSAFAHGVRVADDAVHVCYCHSPFRYAWHERERALKEVPRQARWALDATLDAVARWDRAAAGRVTRYVANSQVTRQRIADAYGRDAAVVHPPVDVGRFEPRPELVEDFVVFVGELVRHKRVEVALEAARLADRRIKVVGTGPDEARLRVEYPRADFLGRLDDRQLSDLLPRAAALVMPNVEEFGIAAVEAQAAGRPVVAVAAGGALETVRDGATGVLVENGTASGLAEALRGTDFGGFDPVGIRRHAERFSVASFRSGLSAEVERAIRAR